MTSMNGDAVRQLTRGDARRERALAWLQACKSAPKVRELAAAIGWSTSTAHNFIREAEQMFGLFGLVRRTAEQPNKIKPNMFGEQPNEQTPLSPSSSPPTPPLITTPISPSASGLDSDESKPPAAAAPQGRFDFNMPEEARADILADMIWRYGVRLLTADGTPTADARAFLGKRIADVGRETLARAILEATIQCVADPRAYLGAVKRNSQPTARRRFEPTDDAWGDVLQPWQRGASADVRH